MLTGVSSVEWTLKIVNDGIEEGNDEKFKLFLENATNAILGNSDKTQIHLIDFEDGKRSTLMCIDYYGLPYIMAGHIVTMRKRGSAP